MDVPITSFWQIAASFLSQYQSLINVNLFEAFWVYLSCTILFMISNKNVYLILKLRENLEKNVC